jgi:predicted RND superfamily exporter protein
VKSFYENLCDLLLSLYRYCLKRPSVSYFFLVVYISLIILIKPWEAKFSFDFAGLNSRSKNSEANQAQFILKKRSGEITERDLCHFKKLMGEVPSELGVRDIITPLSFFRPEESDGKLLYRPLINIDCFSPEYHLFLDEVKRMPVAKNFINANPSDVMISAEFEMGERFHQDKLPRYVEQMESWLIKNFPGYQVFSFGSAAVTRSIFQMMKKDLVINVILVLTFIALFYIFFGDFFSSCFYFLTVFLTSGFILSLMKMFEIDLNPLTTSLFVIISVSCIEDFLYLLAHSFDISRDQPFENSIELLLIPCFFTSLTTFVGFGSLVISPLQELRSFGLLAAIGAMFEWGCMFLIMPALIKRHHLFDKHMSRRRRFRVFFSKIMSFTPRKGLTVLSLGFMVFGMFSFFQLKINESLNTFFTDAHPLVKASGYFYRTRGFKRTVDVKFSSYESMNLFRNEFKSIKNIVGFSGLYLFRDEAGAQLGELAKELYHQDFESSLSLQILLETDQLIEIERVVTKLNQACKRLGCVTEGRMASYATFARGIVDTLYQSLGLTLVIVSIIILWLATMLGIHEKWKIILSSLWGPFVLCGIFYLLKLPLNFTTCIFASVFLGLSGDNAIQYIFISKINKSKLDSDCLGKIGLASIYIGLFTALGSLAFTFSGFTFISTLGWIFFLGFLLMCYGDLFFLKGLFEFRRKGLDIK